MTSLTFVLLSGTLSFGVPLVLAVRELFALPSSSSSRGGDEPPPPERFPRAPTPLPDCLLPERVLRAPAGPAAPRRIRLLEDA